MAYYCPRKIAIPSSLVFKHQKYMNDNNQTIIIILCTLITMMSIRFCFLFLILASCSWISSCATAAADGGVSGGEEPETILHRVFPAATTESYTEDSVDLGVVRPKDLTFTINGPQCIQKVLDPAVQRFKESLQRDIPDFPEDYPENPLDLLLHPIKGVDVHVESSNIELHHNVPEQYSVSVDIKQHPPVAYAAVRAETVFGALRGLETLAQLFEFGWIDKSSKNNEPVFVVNKLPIHIEDNPTYSYRGLMIDTARHYLPLELILRNLDAMAMNKFNVLHWHLTDSQSFPWQTKSLPEVANKGAYHPKRIYTTEDVQTVINEAYLRGIHVVPEVDLPGHSRIISNSHPEIMSHCPEPSEPVDPTNPKTFEFVETIYADLKELFPGEYVHLGGDEVNFNCWNQSKAISKWMHDHNMSQPVELYEYFETRLLRIVDKIQKTPIVWQEVFNLNLTISNDTIVDVWKGFDRKTMEQATNQSYRVILSGCWYLDHLGDTWETYYRCDPGNFTSNHHELMIGGHASMWGEHVDASNFMSRVWPRASAAAEVLWTGNVTKSGAKDSIKERIHAFRCRLVQQGISAGPTGPGFCPHEVPYMDEVVSSRGCPAASSEVLPCLYSNFFPFAQRTL